MDEHMRTGQFSIEEYLRVLASKAAVPGGGGASALAGAQGAALGQMVVELTVGKKKYAAVEETMQELRLQLEELRAGFLDMADEDARVFAPLAQAYALPAATEEEKTYKEQVMEERLLAASLAPLRVMEQSLELMHMLELLAKKGSRLAVSDAGVGVQFARTALTGAVMNVRINTKSMKNREEAERINRKAQELLTAGTALADEIYRQVWEELA